MDSTLRDQLNEIDWSFDSADTQFSTHGISKYPARMIPQIPDTLLDLFQEHGYLSENATVYDPFVGSGTTLISAKMDGLNGIGNDINPYAVYLTKVKTTPIDTSDLDACWYDIKTNILENIGDISENEYTDSNLNDGWFPEPQLSQLLYIREELDILEEAYSEELIHPFRIALATICRECSYQRNGEFKRYRMPEEKRTQHTPFVKDLYTTEVIEMMDTLKEFSEEYDNNATITVQAEDSRNSSLQEDSIDAVITSPPYGDHSTTVAYGQFSRDPAIIAFGESKTQMLDVDKTGLGGRNSEATIENLTQESKALDRTLTELEKVEGGRTDDALTFFTDFYLVMEDLYRVLKPGQPLVWVVANRTMSRTPIPTHIITTQLCESLGFTHEQTLPRSIPSKTLPWENAPENETGNTGKLMADENIIILTK